MMRIEKRQLSAGLTAAFAAAAAGVWAAGCGGGGGGGSTPAPTAPTTNPDGRSFGKVQLTVKWPEGDGATRLIPERTRSLRVTVTSIDGMYADGARSKSVTADRPVPPPNPNVSQITVDGVPPGSATVDVVAFDADGSLVARAPSQLITVQPGVANPFAATLVPETIPIPAVKTLAIDPATIIGGGGAKVKGTVTLTGIAPIGGAQVQLSGGGSAVSYPATVTVPGEQATVDFEITVNEVGVPTPAEITATFNTTTASAVLQVGAVQVASVALNPTSVVGGRVNSTGTVTLDQVAPFPVAVQLASDNTGAATVPANLTIPQGQQSGTFTVTSRPIGADATANISATRPGGAPKSAALQVIADASLESLTVIPGTVVGGDANATGTVTLNKAAPLALNVSLRLPAGTTKASVPSSVPIPAGQKSATFTVTTFPVINPRQRGAFVASTVNTIVIANYNSPDRAAPLSITPRSPSPGHPDAPTGACNDCHLSRAVRVPSRGAAVYSGMIQSFAQNGGK